MSTAASSRFAPDLDFVAAPVVAVIPETRELTVIRVARPDGFDFRAGQSANVAFDIEGIRQIRRVPISSAPESGVPLDLVVRRRGAAAEQLIAAAGVGTFLSVQPAGGSFVFPDADLRPIVLVGGGDGAAPLMSMVRHAMARERARPLTLLLSCRTADEIPFRRDLQLLIRQYPALRVGVTLTRDERRPGFRTGRVDQSLLRRAAPDLAGTLFLLCCPPSMLDETRQILAGLGVPAAHVHHEIFDRPAALAVPALSSPVPDPRVAPGAGEPIPPANVLPFPAPSEPSTEPGSVELPRKEQAKEILRFATVEMMLHWAIALPFMACVATGMVVKLFYGLHGEGISRDVLTFLHRVAGGCLAIFPSLAIMRNWRQYKVLVYNVKVGFSWTIDDLKWLFLIGPSTIDKRVVLPEQRKFNAAERLNFMMVMVTYPVFIASGILLWIPGSHFVPWLVHVGTALVVPGLMFGHIYMAVVNPGTRIGLSGMFSGRVDREWARHHYAAWYRDHFHEDGTPRAGTGT